MRAKKAPGPPFSLGKEKMRRLPIRRRLDNPPAWPLLNCLSDECREKLLAAYPHLQYPVVVIPETAEEMEKMMRQAPTKQKRVA